MPIYIGIEQDTFGALERTSGNSFSHIFIMVSIGSLSKKEHSGV